MIRPLRGRVVIRPLVPKSIGHIVLPDMSQDWERNAQKAQGIKSQASHFGSVIAMGPPARSKKGRDVQPGFAVGDRVLFVWTHNELEFTKEWSDGLPCCWVGQENVIAVLT